MSLAQNRRALPALELVPAALVRVHASTVSGLDDWAFPVETAKAPHSMTCLAGLCAPNRQVHTSSCSLLKCVSWRLYFSEKSVMLRFREIREGDQFHRDAQTGGAAAKPSSCPRISARCACAAHRPTNVSRCFRRRGDRWLHHHNRRRARGVFLADPRTRSPPRRCGNDVG